MSGTLGEGPLFRNQSDCFGNPAAGQGAKHLVKADVNLRPHIPDSPRPPHRVPARDDGRFDLHRMKVGEGFDGRALAVQTAERTSGVKKVADQLRTAG